MSAPQPVRIDLYADLSCPYAYVTHYRLRRLRDEWRGRVVVAHRSLALEYVNSRPTPKPIIDHEAPILMREEPGIPYRPWAAPDSHWPVTIWPAFEAVKAAERQGLEAANDMAWAIRRAFFAEGRCISLRHVLLELAKGAGLDMARFTADFDGGVGKARVIAEARAGWEELKVEGSPTFVLPSGEQVSYPGLPQVDLDEQTGEIKRIEPAPCSGDACLALLRDLIDRATREAAVAAG